ncbi:MAG: hypothetical protein U1C47_04690, partial [Hydrogenophaga sp.]|nr:hypothetical protein [Hydrogenophaga sp.]
TDALGRTTRTERDPASNPTRTTRADGSVVTRTFDARGNVLSQTEQANGATTRWTYDDFDQITSSTDPRGHTTTFERDAKGNLTRIVNPLGHEIRMEYDERGLLTRRIDPNGLITEIDYNEQGLPAQTVETPADDPSRARTTTFEYTAFGEVSQTISPTGAVRIFSYDPDGRVIAIEDSLGQRTEIAYDESGNLTRTEVFDADGTTIAVLEQRFDEEDRLIETRAPHTDSQDAITQFAYDGEGNQTGQVDPNGRITVQDYDPANRLIRTLNPVGDATELIYDARDQTTRVIAPNGAATGFVYDALSRQTAEHSPDRGSLHQEYDRADNLTASTDARGIRRTLAYDVMNRVTQVRYPDPREDIEYRYDDCPNGRGRLCRIDDQSGSLRYDYDGFGNIARTVRTEGGIEYTTNYEYDPEDRLTALIYPSGRRIEYDRDILGRITAVRAEVAGTMQPLLSAIRYRPDGQIISARHGNGLTQTRRHDQQGRLREQHLFDDSGTTLDLRQYAYDPAGNLIARTGSPGDQHYDYDELDRLIGQRIAANDQDWQYAYDPNHNRQQRTDSVLNEVYGYRTNSNRLTEIDRLLASAPEQSAPRSQRFEYNQAGRLAEYRADGQPIAHYTYNALGQRTRKELEHETRLYHYDIGIQLLSE